MSKTLRLPLLLLLAFAVATVALAQRPGDVLTEKPSNNPPYTAVGPLTRPLDAPATAAPPPRQRGVSGLITYDDGIVTSLPTASGFCIGNQFNTGFGEIISRHTVTRMTFFMATGAGTDDVFVSLYGPVAGTTAPFYGDLLVPLNNGPGMFNTVNLSPLGTFSGLGSFLAGVWYVAGDTVGLGTGTVAGQGHHGMMINDIAATGFATLPGHNALVRAVNAILPVELLSFSVADE